MNCLAELVQKIKSPNSPYSRLKEEVANTKDERIVESALSTRKEDFALKTVEKALKERRSPDFQPAVDISDRMNSRFVRDSTKWHCVIRPIGTRGYTHKVFCDQFIKIKYDGFCVFIFRK